MSKKEKETAKIAGTLDTIRKDYGNVLIPADVLSEHEGKIIPVTLGLDLALGGGFPEGTAMTIAGVTGSGKSTLALTIAANAQAMDKDCFYIDAEARLRSELLACIPNLNPSKLSVIRSSEDRFLVGEDYFNIIDTIVSERKGCFIVVDSTAVFQSESSASVKFGESKRMTAMPTLMYEFFRKCMAKIHALKSNLVLVTHLQANVGGYGGPVEVGGNAQKYSSSIRMLCHGSQEIPENGPKTGRISKFKIPKSALGPPGEAVFPIEYGKGYDYARDLAEIAQQMALIEKTGAWYTITDDKYKDKKIQGIDNVMDVIKQDSELAKRLDSQIRTMVLGK